MYNNPEVFSFTSIYFAGYRTAVISLKVLNKQRAELQFSSDKSWLGDELFRELKMQKSDLYIFNDIRQHNYLEEAARRRGISPTQIKPCFKENEGLLIYEDLKSKGVISLSCTSREEKIIDYEVKRVMVEQSPLAMAFLQAMIEMDVRIIHSASSPS